MTRKYPEMVLGNFALLRDSVGILMVRQSAEICFGESTELLGTVFMTNPGRFKLDGNSQWQNFVAGIDLWTTVTDVGRPDMTMQNIIKVIRDSYSAKGLGAPNGRVRIVNISSARQPDGGKAEEYHERIKNFLFQYGLIGDVVLEDPAAHSENHFREVCRASEFVIMGFVRDAFVPQYKRLVEWSRQKDIADKIVWAEDKHGHYSHPRRWRTEPHLGIAATSALESVL